MQIAKKLILCAIPGSICVVLFLFFKLSLQQKERFVYVIKGGAVFLGIGIAYMLLSLILREVVDNSLCIYAILEVVLFCVVQFCISAGLLKCMGKL